MPQNIVRGGWWVAPPEGKPARPKLFEVQLRNKSTMAMGTRPVRPHHGGATAVERQDVQNRERACVCVLEMYWRLYFLIDVGTELDGVL